MHDGREYSVGSRWVDNNCMEACNCNDGGMKVCKPLCAPSNLMCPADQVKVSIKVSVPGNSRCKCDRYKCIASK